MLTELKARSAKPGERPYKLADRDGLYLYVPRSGAKVWRLRTQSGGKDTVRTLGAYPAMSLAEARRAAQQGQAIPASTGPTLQQAAREWHAAQVSRWKPHHAADVLESLETHVFPTLGSRPLADITAPMILAVLRPVEIKSADIAHRIRQRLAAVWAFAIASGHAAVNPAAGIEKALRPVVRQRHRPALLDLDAARAMLTTAESVAAHPVTRLALRLLALTAVRPGEVRAAEWREFAGLDGADAVWTIPAERMKHTRERAADTADHVVPLSTHALDVLAAAATLTGGGRLVFPSTTDVQQPLSENAIGYLLNRAGFHGRHVPHGFRATFSTIMNERFPADRAVIDLMLAHTPASQVERAYNRATHTARRRMLAQAWGDLLMDGMPAARALLEMARR